MITRMTIYFFGNPDVLMDSLPLRLLPKLREYFPKVVFEVMDPAEEWNVPEDVVVLDTVEGISDVVLFDDLEKFIPAPRLSMHDFDALANVRFLKKLGKIKSVKVIGVPFGTGEQDVFEKVVRILNDKILK